MTPLVSSRSFSVMPYFTNFPSISDSRSSYILLTRAKSYRSAWILSFFCTSSFSIRTLSDCGSMPASESTSPRMASRCSVCFSMYSSFRSSSEFFRPDFCCSSSIDFSNRRFSWSRSSTSFSQRICRTSCSSLRLESCFWLPSRCSNSFVIASISSWNFARSTLSSSLCFSFSCWISSSAFSSFSRSSRFRSRLSFSSSRSCSVWSSWAIFSCVIISARSSPMCDWCSYCRCFISCITFLVSCSASSCATSTSRSFPRMTAFASSSCLRVISQ
uniref:Uncharacterized protein n=1 Tax=Anopheles atroparvus TaxID=41427 RepID=A0A182ITZ0_ANOAO